MTTWPKRNLPIFGGRAFTIVEAVISVAIVGILMATSLTAMGQIARLRAVQVERRAALELGQQLLVEILAQYYQDPGNATFGPATGMTRATFNGVDEYNGYSESPPTLKNGTVLSDFTGWTRSVVGTYANPANPSIVVASSTLKQVTVTVTSPSGKQYSLFALRSQYGPYESTPWTQMNYVTWVGVNLQAGSTPKTIRTAARPLSEFDSQP
jgi:MSHA pilin protein MshD